MRKSLIIFISVVICGSIVAFAMTSLSEPDLQLRYKITINVQTPEGIKSGSSVREFTINKFQGFNPDKADFNADIRGEAVVVDLGEKGKLFALINPNSYREMLYAFPIVEETAPLSLEGIEYYKNLKVGDRAVLENKIHWPKFVTFTDMNDPTSVQPVDPYDLSATFGDGVRLQDIQVQVTEEEISWDISQTFPWLKNYKNKKARLSGSTSIAIFTSDLADNLGTGAFSKGEKQ